MRRQICGGERFANQRRNIGAIELNRRKIDGHGNIARPTPTLETRIIQDLIADLDDEAHFLGNRNELSRRHHSTLVVRPAQQCFAGLYAPGLQIEDRLIVEFKRLVLGRAAQIKFERSARLGVRFHFGFEPAPRPTAVGLRLIKRNVGVTQKLLRIDRGCCKSNPDAGGHDDFVAVEIVSAAHGVEDACRESLALLD